MAKPSIASSELIEKGGDADFVRDMLHFAAQQLMEMDIEQLCGLPYGERGPSRQNARNGFRDRTCGNARELLNPCARQN